MQLLLLNGVAGLTQKRKKEKKYGGEKLLFSYLSGPYDAGVGIPLSGAAEIRKISSVEINFYITNRIFLS